MTQTINGLEVSKIVRFEKFNRAMVQVIFVDETYVTMSCGDFERNVKRIANPNAVTRFDTNKSDAYNDSMKEGHVGLEATSKQSGLGRWR